MTWIPDEFEPPSRVDLPTGHHLRPIRESDVDIDYPAVMGSQGRLWAKYGEAWGWPPASMTREEDREDLARHEAEIAAKERRAESFLIREAVDGLIAGATGNQKSRRGAARKETNPAA